MSASGHAGRAAQRPQPPNTALRSSGAAFTDGSHLGLPRGALVGSWACLALSAWLRGGSAGWTRARLPAYGRVTAHTTSRM